ncbi:MAG: hypothetical protein GX117_04990 [Candidatus Hydrogenedentes bacterium]|nr:hypothetical protein [Candidatus Hydrogenedentota bacterium]
MEKEKKLLNEILNGEGGIEQMPENYPDTVLDKVGYAQYSLTRNLGNIGKAVDRLSRLYTLLLVAEKSGGVLPDIITNNELRMALEPLMRIQGNINELVEMLLPIYRETKKGQEATDER